MGSIHLLAPDLINKIAAGEVVERPASVAKELLENSLDAGATAITIEIEDGGLSLIRITDNGKGMGKEDALLSLTRHATSKLSSEEDLYAISTLGFRGEALASIAAVSRLEILTRRPQAEEGVRVVSEGGSAPEVRAAGCPAGTAVAVRDLFYNTPARRKFLRKPAWEGNSVMDLVSRLALARPEVSFRAFSNKKEVYKTPGDGKLDSAVCAVYGLTTMENLIPLTYAQGETAITGYIGNFELEKRNRSYQTLFINGRYVKNNTIGSAVAAGYQNRLNTGRYPMFVLNMALPFSLVDVNVHPQKTEVRFSTEMDIYGLVYHAVKNCLDAHVQMPALTPGHSAVFGAAPPAPAFSYVQPEALRPDDRLPETFHNAANVLSAGIFAPSRFAENDLAAWRQDAFAPEKTPSAEGGAVFTAPETQEPKQLAFGREGSVVGQLFTTYVLVQNGEEAYIIDQHAAHERLLYERLRAEADSSAVVSQELLVPYILECNYAERQSAERLLPFLAGLGFEIEDFGGASLAVRAVPLVFAGVNLQKLLSGLLTEEGEIRALKTSDLKRERLLQSACKHAIRGGDVLAGADIAALLAILQKEEVPLTCPHGRPILIRLTKEELEQRFARSMG